MSAPESRPMAPGPVYAPGFHYGPRRPWLALWPRKNKDKQQPQAPKGWGWGGNKPPHKGGQVKGGGKK